MTANFAALAYLVASVLFIMALRGLSSPETARTGNTYGIAGMVIAGVTTVATNAIVMPMMPRILPWRASAGEDRPRSAMMNSTEATR